MCMYINAWTHACTHAPDQPTTLCTCVRNDYLQRTLQHHRVRYHTENMQLKCIYRYTVSASVVTKYTISWLQRQRYASQKTAPPPSQKRNCCPWWDSNAQCTANALQTELLKQLSRAAKFTQQQSCFCPKRQDKSKLSNKEWIEKIQPPNTPNTMPRKYIFNQLQRQGNST